MCVGRVDGGMHGPDLSPHSQVAFMVSCEQRLSGDLRHGGSERLRVEYKVGVCGSRLPENVGTEGEGEMGLPTVPFLSVLLPQQQTESVGEMCLYWEVK